MAIFSMTQSTRGLWRYHYCCRLTRIKDLVIMGYHPQRPHSKVNFIICVRTEVALMSAVGTARISYLFILRGMMIARTMQACLSPSSSTKLRPLMVLP